MPKTKGTAKTKTTRNTHRIGFRVLIESDEDGWYVARCPSLPGCISQGKTRREAMANIKEAIELYLESLKKHGEPIPPPIEEEIVRVAI